MLKSGRQRYNQQQSRADKPHGFIMPTDERSEVRIGPVIQQTEGFRQQCSPPIHRKHRVSRQHLIDAINEFGTLWDEIILNFLQQFRPVVGAEGWRRRHSLLESLGQSGCRWLEQCRSLLKQRLSLIDGEVWLL